MSIVKYKNKKTGVVTWYESTSHYDPKTKQSRPKRKYLGREDPVTGELIPSSGRRGRKSDKPKAQDRESLSTLKKQYEKEIAARDKVIEDQKKIITKLREEKSSIISELTTLLNELNKD